MHEVVDISGITPETVGRACFEELRRIHPDGYGVGRPASEPPHERRVWLDVRLPRSDPRVDAILHCLRAAGLTPHCGAGQRQPNQYEFMIFREFSESDLTQCQFLTLVVNHRHDGYSRDLHGRIKVNAVSLPRKGGFTGCVAVLVSETVRQTLASAGLIGMKFLPASIGDFSAVDEGENEVVEYDGRTWWELTTDVILPPIHLGPGMALIDVNGQPVCGSDFSRGCFLREGFVQNPELCYRASDLAAMPPFDIAKTFEIFGNPPLGGRAPSDDNRLLVVSKRFYDLCREIGESVTGSPLRIVQD